MEHEQLIIKIRSAGLPVDAFGAGWDEGPLSNRQVKELPQKYKVTLGSSTCGATNQISIIKGRDFEVPLNKGLYLTNYSESLSRIYKVNDEVLTYQSFQDCIKN